MSLLRVKDLLASEAASVEQSCTARSTVQRTLRMKVAQLPVVASQRAPVTNADPNASVATAVPTSRPASCTTPAAQVGLRS
jgi:hypothetical protein